MNSRWLQPNLSPGDTRRFQRVDPSLEAALVEFVRTKIPLGIYDPVQPRRARVDVVSFEVELSEFDSENMVVHVAGPVVLRGPEGDVDRHLRVSLPVDSHGRILENADVRAVYIVETDPESGACKETAALANA